MDDYRTGMLSSKNNKTRKPNSDGLIKCLPQPGTASRSILKSMPVNSVPFIKPFGARTDPAAETKSIGLPADALVPRFLLAIQTISP